jgi:inosine-uridine nucleoside N-ribohydrolase
VAPLVIDTDMGLDDAVALALALQHPRLETAAIVACEGAAGQAAAVHSVERMLAFFNRQEIRVYASNLKTDQPAPVCRERAEALVDSALPETSVWLRLPFAPSAYRVKEGRTTVLALGPMSQLAAALERDPALATAIERVVIAGDPADRDSWNLARDPKALKAVRRAAIRLQFVAARGSAPKPTPWNEAAPSVWRTTSIGDAFLDRLLAEPDARRHYLETLDQLHDELAMLFVIEPGLFEATGSGDVYTPREGVDVGLRLAELMRRGRQRKLRVVLADQPLPSGMLQPDIRERRGAILAANGEDEWFAQLLLNELHEHLGAYSIIGVKMALRAAELLNAPPHGMTILSMTSPTQPVSCLNDGLLVATGSTPGRGLFHHQPGPPGAVEAKFDYNRRSVTLRLKSSYRDQIRMRIEELLQQYSLSDPGYWEGVRVLGLDIWESWHRLDLFDVTSADGERPGPTGKE